MAWLIIRYFIQKLYIFKNVWLRIFIYWSMVYWSKFKPIEIEDNINITLVINESIAYQKWFAI